jgi:hypothetical protein
MYDAVPEAENRGRRTDAKREREDRDGRKARRSLKRPKRVADVLTHGGSQRLVAANNQVMCQGMPAKFGRFLSKGPALVFP